MSAQADRRVTAAQGLAFNSLKQLIHWGEEFKVSHGPIDAQHELIFALAVRASELSRREAESGLLAALFLQFGEVLEAHFQYEENVLAEVGYRGLAEHRAEHRVMLAELAYLRSRLAGKLEGFTFQDDGFLVLNFMLGATVGHILRSDAEFAPILRRPAADVEAATLEGAA
jgi:hemerythrin